MDETRALALFHHVHECFRNAFPELRDSPDPIPQRLLVRLCSREYPLDEDQSSMVVYGRQGTERWLIVIYARNAHVQDEFAHKILMWYLTHDARFHPYGVEKGSWLREALCELAVLWRLEDHASTRWAKAEDRVLESIDVRSGYRKGPATQWRFDHLRTVIDNLLPALQPTLHKVYYG
jgi:hypothetical protein